MHRLISTGFMLFAVLIANATIPVLAEENLNVFNAHTADPPPTRLYRWLQEQAKKYFDDRRAVVAALKTPEEVRRRQQDLKQKFVDALGGFPEKTPLNPQVTGRIEREDFSVEKVVYESRPHHHVTACFYLPKGTGPFPGVIVPCGHSVNGKANEGYQRACISMAKNGIAVLCYDPIGQGERVQLLDATGKPAIPGSTSEHTMVGIGALLVGTSCATYRIWDGIRSLDYLASRPEVDPKRLGCTGNSGGGTLTSYLMALDERIVAAAPSCYITTLEKLFATIGPQDAEQNITGQVAFGMEHADYVTMRAPAPTLICVGTKDYFNIDGAWTTFREAKSVYGILGYGERVDLFEFNDPHGFSIPRRQASMRWMRRWLLDKNDSPFEAEFAVFKDPELQVTRTGQVLDEFKGVSAFDLNRMQAEKLATSRGQSSLKGEALRVEVRKLIQLPDAIPVASILGEPEIINREGYQIQKLAIETEKGIVLPCHLWLPMKMQAEAQPVLYLHDQGKGAVSAPGGELEQFVKSGRVVLAADPRGMGELAPGKAKGPFGADTNEAFLSLHLNRPLLGQRVIDVLSLAGLITSKLQPGTNIEVIATGSMCPIAQHAALFDPRIVKLALRGGIASWTDVAKQSISQNQLTNAVPFALKHYDLTDLPGETQ